MNYVFLAADVLSIAMLAVAFVLSLVDSSVVRCTAIFWASIGAIAWLFSRVLA